METVKSLIKAEIGVFVFTNFEESLRDFFSINQIHYDLEQIEYKELPLEFIRSIDKTDIDNIENETISKKSIPDLCDRMRAIKGIIIHHIN